jgi:hypothetical protein
MSQHVNITIYDVPEVPRMFVNFVVEKLGLVCYLQINEVGKAESRISFFRNSFRELPRSLESNIVTH